MSTPCGTSALVPSPGVLSAARGGAGRVVIKVVVIITMVTRGVGCDPVVVVVVVVVVGYQRVVSGTHGAKEGSDSGFVGGAIVCGTDGKVPYESFKGEGARVVVR